MAPSPPWADLNQEILGHAFRLHPSIADLARASAVCRSWRSVALQNPPPLPLLLMPAPNGPSYFRVFGETTHQLPQVPDHARGARFCCSFPGGWVLVELPGSTDLELLNIYDGTRRIELPDHPRHQDAYHPMVIYAATMSAAPTPDAGAGACIVAAITAEENHVAFWRSGMGFWSREVLPEEAQHGAAWLPLRFHLAQDVMYYRGAPRHPDVHGDCFCVLTDTEDLLWNEPGDGEGGALTMRVRETQCHSRERMITPTSSDLVVARYLLVSGEDLLMVKRFNVQGRDAGTISANVYCLQERG
ncbi:uncharacterized protein LOC104583160 [Brachypodium distachyon]|nr:uncharacterized protein LOC104583160 [Brachypodium distachyon]|eukprot:XP_010233228.1 uncharacterized protein LOC104583160 [Brachypodium distachyon]